MDKKREEENGAGKIRNKRLREQQQKEQCAKCIDNKIVEQDEVTDVEEMQVQMKQAMGDSTREVYGGKEEFKE